MVLKRISLYFQTIVGGGRLYDKFSLPYLTPTIGLSMTCADFLELLENLDYFLSVEPVIIEAEQKRVNNEFGIYNCMLGNIKIDSRHYRDAKDAIAKWNRRKKRIFYDNIIVKMSYYTDEIDNDILYRFSRLPYKKILFTNKKELLQKEDLGRVVFIDSPDGENEFILSDSQLKLKEIKSIINQ